MLVRANQNDTLDKLCWRHLRNTDAVIEALALNPGIAEHGPVLPHGLIVKLPDLVNQTNKTTPIVQLWD